MNEVNIQNETLKKFEELALDAYMLYCKLDRYKDKMTERAFKFTGDKLEWLFREEFERIFAPYVLKRLREKFQEQERTDALAPRRWRPWYFLWLRIRENRAAKLIVQEIGKETAAILDKFEKKIASSKNEPPTPQNPEKSGVQEQDHKSDEPPKSPKTGISPQGSTTGANDQSPQAAPTKPTKKAKEKA